MKSSIRILLLSAAVALAESPEAIQHIRLDESAVVTVPRLAAAEQRVTAFEKEMQKITASPSVTTNDVPAFSPESNDSPRP